MDLNEYLGLLFATSAHWLQWREKDLDLTAHRPLLRLAAHLAHRSGRIFLVNSLVEPALQQGAQGAHLTSQQDLREAQRLRRQYRRPEFILGKSVHSEQAAQRAQREGADYVLLGPVFSPLSKPGYSPPLGISRLKATAQSLHIPVFALGGLSRRRFAEVLRANAIGAAGITWMEREIQALLDRRP